MVKRIVWSRKAAAEKRNILTYWSKKNGNKTYSRKLNLKFRETLRLISDFNYLGKNTDYKDMRVAVVESYLIFYRSLETQIEIVTVFDSRRNPDELVI
ncbi:MAG TPA: type II toxin-antitoxin system RelE/ParE family toxin [Ignavibacteria bacterium]|nr:type II toxin-antitoxin system RelE/ParE family toxin [Ignavibacteria bacterium]HMQ97617.1 type II toxin-antitoxin system RelE/ParE family toxin [Ignavibacteria bacterium]